MSAAETGESKALCGDPTCEGPGCRQEAIDAYNQRAWHAAGHAVAAIAGLTYDETTGHFGSSQVQS